MKRSLQAKNLLRLSVSTVVPILFLAAGSILAAVSGKISGVVEDATTKVPVIGATVKVVGTNLVTQTDEDGEYFFLNVPVGKYDVAVTHVGFETILKKEVRVLVDLTTPVDFAISELAVEMNKEQVVYAAEPMIQRDLTASRVIFTADRLKNLPNIVTIQSVLSNYPGVINDRDNELHVRGGRAGQLAYLYDGFSVQDPFVSDIGIRIMPAALEELSLTSGGFGAEYGDAQSGIVSAVTREGSSAYHGNFRSYEGFTHKYDVSTAKWGSLSRNDNRSMSFDLSGPVPGLDPSRYSFFGAGEYLREATSLPHDLSIGYTGTFKLSMQPMQRLRIKGHGSYSTSEGDLYEHRDNNGASFDFNLDGLPSFEKKAYLGGITSHYSVSERTIISASFNRFSTRTFSAPKDLMGLHWSQWPGYSEDSNGVYNGTIHVNNYRDNPDYTDPLEAVGYAMGSRYKPTYSFRQADYNAVATNFTNQLNKSNQIKTGFDYKHYNVDRDFRQFYNDKPYAETYKSKPNYFSWFMQDKMEYADFVINLGLRYDYVNTDISYNSTPGATPTYVNAAAKDNWSPRLGISFPISDRSVMHFNYGSFYQMPRYYYLYLNVEGDVTSGLPLLGNPDLQPEQTTSYEIGLDHMLNDGIRLDATAYYKDVSDLVTTRALYRLGTGAPVTRFLNGDYGSVTGFDVSVEKIANKGPLSGSLSYSYMNARGTGSTATEPYYTFITSTTDTLPPVTEFALDYDQRHTVTAVVDLRFAQDWNGRLLGVKLPGSWGVNMVGYYGSGLPYTKTDYQGNRLGERNEGRLPAAFNVDARFNKDFQWKGSARMLTFFVEVDNLFNRRNVINVYTQTGQADFDNQSVQGGFSLNQSEVDAADKLYDHDPQNYSPPRTIRTGFQLSF